MSWIRGWVMARRAITAFSHFSTACWAWKPMIPSAISGFPPNSRTAVASSRALRASRAARFSSSSSDKDSSGPKCLVDHGPWDFPEILGLLPTYDDHVERDFEVTKLATQASRLCAGRGGFGLDHK